MMSTNSEKVAHQKSFEVEVDVPGTPEEIWQAIATGPGVTLWFTRMEIEGFVGGKVVADPNQPVASTVTAWEPPRRFAYAYPEAAGPHAWEFTIEAQDGGTCKVRLVDSFFVTDGDWSNEIPTAPDGWKWAFDFLVVNQTYFPGQLGASAQAMWPISGSFAESWNAMRAALGLPTLTVGEVVRTSGSDIPTLSGRVVSADERVGIVKAEQPAAGLAWLATGGGTEDQSLAMIHINFFGPDAETVAAREQAFWQEWLQRTFPMAEPAPAPA
jgi:uncharacterized protein YndB with AHSA1/START domain